MESEELLYRSEDRLHNTTVALWDEELKKLCEPPIWLKDAESIFKWFTVLPHTERVTWDIHDKLQDYRNQGADYGFEKYCLLLVLLFEKSFNAFINHSEDENSPEGVNGSPNDNADLPDNEYNDPETLYAKCKDALDEMAAHEDDIMYKRIGPALQHILQATRAHMLFIQGNISSSKEMASNIQPVQEMSRQNIAGIEGIKTKVLMTIYSSVEITLEFSHKAMELDPDFAAWKYLTGKLLRRRRKNKLQDLSEEEIHYFKKAVELERNPKYLVFLGQAYQEMAHLLSLQKSEDNERIKDLLRKAVISYRECWSLKNDSAAISRRVGNGMLKMDMDIGDVALTKEALIKATELSPCPVTFHGLGKFYYKHDQDDEKALECFEKVLGLFGLGEIIRLKLIKDPMYNPYDLVQQLICHVKPYTVKRDNYYTEIAWYYLYYKRDLQNAAKYIWRTLSGEKNSFRLVDFWSYMFCVKGPVNLVEIFINEVLLKRQNALSSEGRDEMEYLEKVLEKIFERHPDLREMTPNPLLMQRIQRDVEGYISYLRRKRYGNSRNGRNDARVNWRSNDGGYRSDQPTYRQQGAIRRDGSYRTRSVNSCIDDINSPRGRENMRRRDEENRGRNRAEGRYYHNNNRFDVTITDWRREPRN